MQTNEIREKYLDFFKSKGHTVCASDVLVPTWDKTVLFTPAGMNPFKDHFLGNIELEFTRATSCQKCLRTGDIENVGRTAYHHTFFEMLGNFSFGDYFKRDAIQWAWEFLTEKKWLGFEADRLTVTVYEDDSEAADIWHKDIGLSLDRITRMDEADNFWPASSPSQGPDGVCGPCSEIFFHPDDGPECEIWNLVFTQFNRSGDPPNNLEPLPSKNIDTGMGLERVASMLQGKKTNYHIDTLQPLVDAAAEVCGRKYDPDNEDGRRLRRVADHVRACTMAIHENVYPDSQQENYVIRRLLRRAVFQGHEMGIRKPFLHELVPAVVEMMGTPYPDLKSTESNVAKVIRAEEERFLNTLDGGLVRIEKMFTQLKSANQTEIDGKEAFDLYQTWGIPAELLESMGAENKFSFDWDGYIKAREQHEIDSGAGQVGVMGNAGPIDEIRQEVKTTEFLGYVCTEESGNIAGLVNEVTREEATEVEGETNTVIDQTRESELETNDKLSNQYVILDRTPMYAESGGQMADSGTITGPTGTFHVTNVQKLGDVFIHCGAMIDGVLRNGEIVTVTVDSQRRTGIQRAHSATHIMHYALQKYVGADAQQRGSKVDEDNLRFDFASLDPVTPEQLAQIETETNTRIAEDSVVKAETLPLEEARKQGAMMLFGEKYPNPVRMVSVGDFSKELCGGIHVETSGQIETFEIVSEESVSAGTRRIVAMTGQKAKENQQRTQMIADEVARALQVPITNICEGAMHLSKRIKALKKQLSSGNFKTESAGDTLSGTTPKSDSPSYFEVRQEVRNTAKALNVKIDSVGERVKTMLADVEKLKKQMAEMDSADKVDADGLISSAEKVGKVQVIVQQLHSSNPNIMRSLIDQVRKKTGPVAIFLATAVNEEKVVMVAGISNELTEQGLSAGKWVSEIAPLVGGKGGGHADLAQAGGKQPEKIKEALIAATDYIKSSTAV